MSHIYLTGDVIESQDMSGLVESSEPDWRMLAITKFQRCGMRVVNPISGVSGAWASDDGLERRVRRALDLIDQCDAVLANLKTPGYGTPMEIFYAHRRGKTVAVVGHSPYSPWVLSHSKARFEDIERAVDFIIEELPRPDVLAWCLQFESQLAEHYEQLPPAGELDYQFFGGDLPVLLLSAHATAYFQEGQFQEPETFTGCLAASISRFCHSHALISCYCSVADPIMHIQSPLMRSLSEFVKAGQVGLIILLSGATWYESPGLAVECCGPKGGVQEDLASRLRLSLSALEPVGVGFDDARLRPFLDYVSEVLNVPVLVVRTHRRYRMPRLQPEPFQQLLQLLGEFVRSTGVQLLRSRS
jgi:hypothetical protein